MKDKIRNTDILYVQYICEKIPKLLKNIQKEQEENEYHIYQSSNRAEFERLRINLNKELMRIKKSIYT